VVANDWTVLPVPELGAWQPTLSVSVVIPAHDPIHLPKVLAGLAAQTYPPHLLEIVVVDDGSEPAVALPEVRPENTKLLRMADGWGRAATCQVGADHSDGDVIHWLDADMVPSRGEVEAQLRWHHAIDYAVVLGHMVFADADALDHVSPSTLRDTIAAGTLPEETAQGEVVPHTWIDKILKVTDGLASAGPRAMRVHTGASASVGRELFQASGGMPVDLVRGEDIVLGYRLRETGGVFIPDPDARCVHLGPSNVMRGESDVNRYNRPFIADKVPEFRGHRMAFARSYEVPYVEVVIPVGPASYEASCATIDALLAGSVPDLVVTLVAEWSSLSEGRRSVLGDERLDLRLVRAAYVTEPRVRLLELAADRCAATFRLTLPDPGWVPAGNALDKLLIEMENDHIGLVLVDRPDGASVQIKRTAAVARARRTSQDGDPLDATLSAVYPSRVTDARSAGFVSTADAPKIKHVRGLAPWPANKR